MSENEAKKPVKRNTSSSVKKPVSKSTSTTAPKRKPVSKTKPEVVEEVVTEVPLYVEAPKKQDNTILWIVVASIGGLFILFAMLSGIKLLGNTMSYFNSNSGISREEMILQQGYELGYNDGYIQGYNDALNSGQQSTYEDPCSYEYMLQYGYQDGCSYIPEGETITPLPQGKQNGMYNEFLQPAQPMR